MPNNALLPVICCALVLTAVCADYGLGQVNVPKPHRLPVESFPAQIGPWHGGAVQAVDPDIQNMLKTAKIVERVYTNPAILPDQGIDLMLLTATEDEDMHSPQACFPSQGWTLSNVHATSVDGEPATQMTAQQDDGPPQTVLYWLTGYFPPAPPRNAFLKHAAAWRTHFILAHNNMSLFVRIIAPDTPLGRRALENFTKSIHAPLQKVIGPGAESVRRDLLIRQM